VGEVRWSIPLADVCVDERITEAAHAAVASGWWSMGPRVAEFERAFAEFVGVRHAFAVGSGTAALHMALLAVGCGPGDEVVLPSLNFVAAANCVSLTGATPVFCDVKGPHDLNLDPEDLERAITPRTRVLLVLHYAGFPCDLAVVQDVAERRGLVVIEDAAHAPGASWNGRMCGSVGRVGCFSFFSNKNLAVGEGGMVVTDDDGVAETIRLLRSHGMTSLTWDRHRGHASTYDVVLTGFNYRFDEIRAAIGLVELERLQERNEARRRVAELYRDALGEIDGVVVPFAGAESSSHHIQVALVPEGAARDAVREHLAARRIQTSFHYPPIHGFTRYRDESSRPLPRTEEVAARLVTLPLYPHLEHDRVREVARAFAEALTAQHAVAAGR
jgi:dTDP-4-amino-4,6-dideoxygalactose transaminase